MDAPLDTEVAIEAPEHIVFSHRVAGPGRRAAAHLIDLVLCYGSVAVLAIVLLFAAGGAGAVTGAMNGVTGASVGLVLLALFAAQWIYFAAWEGLTGRTPGKSALRLRVVTTAGRPVQLGAAALRNILRAADVLPNAYVVGLVSMAVSRRFQRLGDLVAGTMVIVEPPRTGAAPIVLWPPAGPEELAGLPGEVPLDADERAAIELFLRRRGTLGAAREHELASMVAGPLASRLGWGSPDPVRTLAVLYDAAVNAGRSEAPPSSRVSESYLAVPRSPDRGGGAR